MGLGNPEGMANEFMSSALPWVTSSIFTTSPVRYDFSKVSRFISIRNLGPGELAVGFTRNGVLGSNRFIVPNGSQFDADLRVKELHIVATTTSTTGSVLVGLTTSPSRFMPVLTGTLPGTTGSTGWDGVG